MFTNEVNNNQIFTKVGYKEDILMGESYYQALLKDISAAKHSIDLSTYIFSFDHIGKQFLIAFEEAVKRGVKVRLLVDGVGSRFLNFEQIKIMEEKGIFIKIYHPIPFVFWQINFAAHVPSKSKIKNFFYLLTKMNSRNHRKLCIIDDSIVYISSANIDKVHWPENNEIGWRDSSVRIEGVDTSVLKEAFIRSWDYHSKWKMISEDKKRINHFIFTLNYTLTQRRESYRNLIYCLNNCKSRIWITNAYFVPDSYILRALVNAAKRNVDVRILLPKISDVFISPLVANTFYFNLLKNNVAIFEYHKSILHAKLMILDDWFLLGSSNLNTRSLKHDLEVDVVIQTKEARQTLEKQFIIDLKDSKQIYLSDLRKQSFVKSLVGNLLLFLRHWI